MGVGRSSSPVLALLAAMLASAGTALAVERIAYRPLRKKVAPPLIFLITGIGCSLVLVEIFGQVLKAFFGPPFGSRDGQRAVRDRDQGRLHDPGLDRRSPTPGC